MSVACPINPRAINPRAITPRVAVAAIALACATVCATTTTADTAFPFVASGMPSERSERVLTSYFLALRSKARRNGNESWHGNFKRRKPLLTASGINQ